MEGTRPSHLSVISALRFYSKAPTIFTWTTLVSVYFSVSAVNKWIESKGPAAQSWTLPTDGRAQLPPPDAKTPRSCSSHAYTPNTWPGQKTRLSTWKQKRYLCSHGGRLTRVTWRRGCAWTPVSPGSISVSFHHQEILWRAVTIWKLGSAHRMSHEPNFPHNRDRDRFWNSEAD